VKPGKPRQNKEIQTGQYFHDRIARKGQPGKDG
jgi:hypothetical protein